MKREEMSRMIEKNETNLGLKEKEDKKIQDKKVVYKRSSPSSK
jgi:hypothetical protein